MQLTCEIEGHDTLVVHLREGNVETTVPVRPAHAGMESLTRAIEAANETGYGECFWPGAEGGQFWWMFKREAEAMEVIAMFSRGGASGWEHVFRATDAADWVRQRLDEESAALHPPTT